MNVDEADEFQTTTRQTIGLRNLGNTLGVQDIMDDDMLVEVLEDDYGEEQKVRDFHEALRSITPIEGLHAGRLSVPERPGLLNLEAAVG
jgi:hypothetical protein